ncbi:MAG: hypothetical protein KIT09_17380 [Bryobacteraceae bacterium]|nr:hypothetical protein [Bryobacteraceae bacterium]
MNAIAVDSRGQAWITGTHTIKVISPGGNASYSLAFVTKLDAEGKTRLFNQDFGGGVFFRTPVDGAGLGLAIDGEDAAYAVGLGSVTLATPGAIQPSNPSLFTHYPYLVKFDSGGNVAFGAILDPEYQRIYAVSVDASGNAYVGVAGQYRPASAKGLCGWGMTSNLIAISRDGSKVLASRFVGGWILSLTRHESGAVYVSGATTSTAFLATPGAYQSEYPRLSQSAFAAKIDFSEQASPILTCVANAASGWAGRNASGFNGAVAPGELVTIYGEPFEAGEDVNVTFDGVPAPVVYSAVNEINAVVPFRMDTEGGFTQLSIRLGSQVIGPYRLPLSQAVPGIFLSDGSSTVAALNQDGSVNSIANPAPPGSVVAVYVTGAGLYDREIEDGASGPMEPPFPAPVLGVRAAMWSTSWPTIEAPVLFAGQAPGLIAGVVQVNLRIPEGLAPGPAHLVMYFGNFPTPDPVIFVGSK